MEKQFQIANKKSVSLMSGPEGTVILSEKPNHFDRQIPQKPISLITITHSYDRDIFA